MGIFSKMWFGSKPSEVRLFPEDDIYDWTGYEQFRPEVISRIPRKERDYRLITDMRLKVHDRHLKKLPLVEMTWITPGTGVYCTMPGYPTPQWVWAGTSLICTLWQLQDDGLRPVEGFGGLKTFDFLTLNQYNTVADIVNILLEVQRKEV